MVKKATTERVKSLRELTAALDLDLEEVLEDLRQLLGSSGAEPAATHDDLGVLPRELLAHLKRLLEDLLEKENVSVAQELEVKAKGRTSREAFKSTRKMLMKTRDMLRNVYGRDQAEILLLGVPRQIPRDMAAGLLRMCRNTLWQLRDPEVRVEAFPELVSSYPQGKKTFVPLLQEEVDNLRQAYRQYDRGQARLIGFQVARREAMEEYNRCFPEIAKIFECLFRLSQRTEIADSIQPSYQEKGLLLRLVKLRRAIRKGLKEGKERRQKEAAAEDRSA